MNTDEIRLLFEYNYWADHLILTTCARIKPEQYAVQANLGTGYGSLRATLLHLLNSENGWRQLCQGAMVVDWDEFNEVDFPTIQSLKERWQVEEQDMRSYINALTDGDLSGIVRYQGDYGILKERVLWHCLYHLVNHGTQHRSEAAALLTSYGRSPGDFDFTLFINQYKKLPL